MLLSHTQASAPRALGTLHTIGASVAPGAGHPHRTTAALPQLTALGALGFLATTSAHAHEGHGMAGSVHWHATDALGFVVAAAAVVAVVWWTRK